MCTSFCDSGEDRSNRYVEFGSQVCVSALLLSAHSLTILWLSSRGTANVNHDTLLVHMSTLLS